MHVRKDIKKSNSQSKAKSSRKGSLLESPNKLGDYENDSIVDLSYYSEKTGEDLNDVNVHFNSTQARSFGTKAFTKGNEIHFAANDRGADNKEQNEMMSHEIVHVLHQRKGHIDYFGGESARNNYMNLENDANDKGSTLMQGNNISVQSKGKTSAPAVQMWGYKDRGFKFWKKSEKEEQEEQQAEENKSLMDDAFGSDFMMDDEEMADKEASEKGTMASIGHNIKKYAGKAGGFIKSKVKENAGSIAPADAYYANQKSKSLGAHAENATDENEAAIAKYASESEHKKRNSALLDTAGMALKAGGKIPVVGSVLGLAGKAMGGMRTVANKAKQWGRDKAAEREEQGVEGNKATNWFFSKFNKNKTTKNKKQNRFQFIDKVMKYIKGNDGLLKRILSKLPDSELYSVLPGKAFGEEK